MCVCVCVCVCVGWCTHACVFKIHLQSKFVINFKGIVHRMEGR